MHLLPWNIRKMPTGQDPTHRRVQFVKCKLIGKNYTAAWVSVLQVQPPRSTEANSGRRARVYLELATESGSIILKIVVLQP